MGWSIGYDTNWGRDIGYAVPAQCDQPDCVERIDRGLGYVCGGEPYGGERGCGLYFCEQHLFHGGAASQLCDRCLEYDATTGAVFTPHPPKPDVDEWLAWKLVDDSWAQWRADNPAEVTAIRKLLAEHRGG